MSRGHSMLYFDECSVYWGRMSVVPLPGDCSTWCMVQSVVSQLCEGFIWVFNVSHTPPVGLQGGNLSQANCCVNCDSQLLCQLLGFGVPCVAERTAEEGVLTGSEWHQPTSLQPEWNKRGQDKVVLLWFLWRSSSVHCLLGLRSPGFQHRPLQVSRSSASACTPRLCITKAALLQAPLLTL